MPPVRHGRGVHREPDRWLLVADRRISRIVVHQHAVRDAPDERAPEDGGEDERSERAAPVVGFSRSFGKRKRVFEKDVGGGVARRFRRRARGPALPQRVRQRHHRTHQRGVIPRVIALCLRSAARWRKQLARADDGVAYAFERFAERAFRARARRRRRLRARRPRVRGGGQRAGRHSLGARDHRGYVRVSRRDHVRHRREARRRDAPRPARRRRDARAGAGGVETAQSVRRRAAFRAGAPRGCRVKLRREPSHDHRAHARDGVREPVRDPVVAGGAEHLRVPSRRRVPQRVGGGENRV